MGHRIHKIEKFNMAVSIDLVENPIIQLNLIAQEVVSVETGQGVTVSKDGIKVGSTRWIDFMTGSNISLSVTKTDGKILVEITSTASGGGVAITNGSGTTANGTAADLGGAITKHTEITGAFNVTIKNTGAFSIGDGFDDPSSVGVQASGDITLNSGAGNVYAQGQIVASIPYVQSYAVPLARTVNSQALSSNIVIPHSIHYRRDGTGQGYSNNITQSTPTTLAISANRLKAWPLIIGQSITFNSLKSEVTSAVGSTTYRFGIYLDSSGYPGALVANTDLAAYDSTGTGVKTGTPGSNVTLTPGLYWIVINSNGAPTLRANPISALPTVLGISPNLGGSGAGTNYSLVETYNASALPNPYTAGATIEGGVACPTLIKISV